METKMESLREKVEAILTKNRLEGSYRYPLYSVSGDHEALLAVTKQLKEEFDYDCDNEAIGGSWEVEDKILDSLMIFVNDNAQSNRGYLAITKTAAENVNNKAKDELIDAALGVMGFRAEN